MSENCGWTFILHICHSWQQWFCSILTSFHMLLLWPRCQRRNKGLSRVILFCVIPELSETRPWNSSAPRLSGVKLQALTSFLRWLGGKKKEKKRKLHQQWHCVCVCVCHPPPRAKGGHPLTQRQERSSGSLISKAVHAFMWSPFHEGRVTVID